jgi:hypothetical protein
MLERIFFSDALRDKYSSRLTSLNGQRTGELSKAFLDAFLALAPSAPGASSPWLSQPGLTFSA